MALSLKKVPKELWGGKVAPHPYRSCGMPAWSALRGSRADRGKRNEEDSGVNMGI
ncbi:MAG: hypothetical protein RR826_03500 [Christensenellaceae bacterium]